MSKFYFFLFFNLFLTIFILLHILDQEEIRAEEEKEIKACQGAGAQSLGRLKNHPHLVVCFSNNGLLIRDISINAQLNLDQIKLLPTTSD